ncbi:MAG: tetratricopeptide repeat protein [Gammaproteobacteria bacterium SHHR-1]
MNSRTMVVIGLALALTACGGSPRRAAPVTGSDVAGVAQEAQTFGYQDSGFGNGFGDAQQTATDPAGPGGLQETPLRQRAPANKPSSGTVLALLRSAETQERAGQLPAAAATLERALRIQPRNAVLWNQLAQVRFKQGQYARANSLAGKSNALAGDDSALRRNNWLLIARVKKAQGDEYGASEAKAKAGY